MLQFCNLHGSSIANLFLLSTQVLCMLQFNILIELVLNNNSMQFDHLIKLPVVETSLTCYNLGPLSLQQKPFLKIL